MKPYHTLLFAVPLVVLACSEEPLQVAPDSDAAISGISVNESFVAELSFERVGQDTVTSPLTVVGEVTFDEDNVVRVYPIVSGSVEEVNFSLGDYVRKGQLLATILSTDISNYQRDYSVAKSNLEVATKNRDRVRRLHESSFASDKELQTAENEYATAQADFVGKRQILELFGGNAKQADAMYRVVAPKSGYLVERNVNEGTQIRTDNATAMFILSDLKTVWVQANVYESDISRVEIGDVVNAVPIAFPDESFSGRIEKINRILDADSRVVRVRTELLNREEKLLPGMYANIEILSSRARLATVLPESAVFLEQSIPHVIVVRAGFFEKKKVEIGSRFGERVEIVSGLTEGDSVVVKGALMVSNELNNRK